MSQQQAINTYRIASPDDQRLLVLLEALAGKFDTNFSIHVGGPSLGSFRTAQDARNGTERDWGSGRIITSAYLNVDNARVGFHRAITRFGQQNLVEVSNFEAEVFVFRHDHQQVSAKIALIIADVVESYRQEILKVEKPSKAPRDFSDIYARQLADLSQLHHKIILEAEAARQKREDELAAQARANDERAIAQKASLEAQADEVRRQLSDQEAELAARKKEIDDRSHTHARRETRVAITTEVKARQGRPPVSRNTSLYRGTILTVSVTLFLLLAWLTVVNSQEVSTMIRQAQPFGPAFYTIVGRLALLTLGAVGSAAYLLNFLRQMHDDDLRAERDLERYLYDVDRASWVIETVLEAQRRDGEQEPVEIPAEWVQGVTRSLFARSEAKDPQESSLAAVGSLFNFAAEAELGPGGTKLKFNRPGLRALRRRAEAADE
ncbi:hypothetical protein [Caulobacter sp. UNC279MFTsu5.1]|uniref:hypothetical protein n=1 Tax=Caulobacter sp. UNC279MFTsu5.1 TaxID=1502775 RepID=UPI0008E986DA|nr:hypothetical protein [Caulobacter sp. UNC279MFTsu5.1]SFJ48660.1 hypothetical protein SAMN02799626_01913 [Caulobacter sp. UNC279MFTsu5.1]